MYKIKTLLTFILMIFTSIQFVNAQNDNYFSGNISDLVFVNPANSALSNSLSSNLSYLNLNNNNFNYHGLRFGTYCPMYGISGTPGIKFESGRINNSINSYNIDIFYNYFLPITRRFDLNLAANLGYFHNRLDYSNFPVITNPLEQLIYAGNPIVKSDYLSLGLGFVLKNEDFHLGLYVNNINRPVESKLNETEFILPLKWSATAGIEIPIETGRLSTSVLFQHQSERFSFNENSSGLINPLNSLSAFIKYVIQYKYSIGLGIDYLNNKFLSYNALIGYYSLSGFNISYKFGLCPYTNNLGDTDLSMINQITLEYHFATCQSKSPGKYRTVSCPSFGGNSGRNNYSSSNNKSKDIKGGTLTAGEVNDLSKWELWNDISKNELNTHQESWQITPETRYTVQLINTNKKVIADAEVSLYSNDNKIIWQAKTDNTGKAELWANLYNNDAEASFITVKYLEQKYTFKDITEFKDGINILEIPTECSDIKKIDILFVVDATGSMSDEINYLKAELKNVIDSVSSKVNNAEIRLGSLFYRCKDNSYTTRKSPLSNDFDKTIDFINKQSAGEGGDEAVEIALKESVNDFKWSENADARIIFIILDEPPSITNNHISTIQDAVREAAKKGIKIIPVIASGTSYDYNKSLEYLMRSIALATNGTTVFITDHSGVGNSHTAPTTDAYDAEYMNKLFLRLIHQFSVVNSCNTDFSELTTEVTDTTLVEIIEHVVLDSSIIEIQKDNITDNHTENINTPVDDEIEETDLDETEQDDEDSDEITDEIITKSFTFYPNPTNGPVNIEIEGDIEQLFLTDQNGRILERIDTNGKLKLNIDIGKYADGMYYLNYISAKQSFSGKLLLICTR